MRIAKFIFLFFLFPFTIMQANDSLEVCTDNSDWAPYTYYERDSNGNKTNKFIGASVDALKAISKKTGLAFKISGYPWKRCQKSVEVFGKVKKFEAFMDGTQSKFRDERFLRTDPFYSTTLGLFYTKDRFPNGLKIEKRIELTPYKVCGIHGHNHAVYTSIGIKVDTGAKDVRAALTKLLGGRCEVYANSLEPILGDVLLGNFTLPNNIQYTQVKEDKKNYFYFWISRQSPRADKLLSTINQAIKELKEEGKWEDIYKNHIPTGSGL